MILTKESTDRILDEALNETYIGRDLHSYAAFEATRMLHTNWKAALKDGTPLPELLHDIETVKAKLDEHKKFIETRLLAEALLPEVKAATGD